MKQNCLQYAGFEVTVGGDWSDVSATLEKRDAPFTIARPENGVGVLQFSPAIYRSGKIPSPSTEDLRSMLAEFGTRHALGKAFDTVSFSDDVFGVGSSFHSGSDFVRAWYLSDGRNIMLVTYVCDWSRRFEESSECEEIVKTLRFNGSSTVPKPPRRRVV